MKFGSREVCDLTFKAKAPMKFGSATFVKGQPVLVIDTATTTAMEQTVATVYARGGRGNGRLIGWDGLHV